MSNALIIGLSLIMGFVLLFNAFAVWAVESSGLKKYRLRSPEVVHLSGTDKYLRIALNGLLAVGLYFLFAYFFASFVTLEVATSPLRLVLEVLAILLVSDFKYYWMHRAFHWPAVMKRIHGVHHKVHYPAALDGLYLDPFDNLAGLSVFFLGVIIVGPVSTATFLTAVFAYIMINNVNHTGLELPHSIFKLSNHWARKHDHHHGVNPRANYGSIFPFWDMAFGTYE